MITYRDKFVFYKLPQFKMDISPMLADIGMFVRDYLDTAGVIMLQRIEKEAEAAVAHLPSEWAANFNSTLEHTVKRISADFYELVVGSNMPVNYDDPLYMQAMVMEEGTRGVYAGPYGRPVWQSDRLTGPREPSEAKTHRRLPQFEHQATDFFKDFLKNEEHRFFSGLKMAIEAYFHSGALNKYFVPY